LERNYVTNRENWLESAARRAQRETWTLGRKLSRLAELENTSNYELAAELHCEAATVQWLFLCRSPTGERFAEDVQQIASRFSLDVNRLAGLIRRADAVTTLAVSGHDSSEGILLAARDRENDENKP
jgi:hypothetical protein